MNRDEARSRDEPGVMRTESRAGVAMVYPVDGLSRGTWFGGNEHGVLLALLNRYQAPLSPQPVSRGEIIPRALAAGDFDAVNDRLRRLDYQRYNPFDLFLIRRKQVIRFCWDGQHYSEEAPAFKHWFLFSSSGFNPEEVIAYRHSIFRTWCAEMGKKLTDPDEILHGFHLIQTAGLEAQSVLMAREKSHTKSVIQADLGKKSLAVKYFPHILDEPLEVPVSEVLAVRN